MLFIVRAFQRTCKSLDSCIMLCVSKGLCHCNDENSAASENTGLSFDSHVVQIMPENGSVCSFDPSCSILASYYSCAISILEDYVAYKLTSNPLLNFLYCCLYFWQTLILIFFIIEKNLADIMVGITEQLYGSYDVSL